MIELSYKPSFLRDLKKCSSALREEAKEKISLFQKDPFHASLKTHKLKGTLKGRWSFSINYRDRIIFRFEGKKAAILLAVGNHNIYQ
ncbi:MAG TPA: hypothetical protein VJB60_02480 [Candidatus Peribacterales bacterium]|nr:hypothetical protein [Candidatus Peribacterales bacterium]